jgi:hypothetical protein
MHPDKIKEIEFELAAEDEDVARLSKIERAASYARRMKWFEDETLRIKNDKRRETDGSS